MTGFIHLMAGSAQGLRETSVHVSGGGRLQRMNGAFTRPSRSLYFRVLFRA